jgi:hypothetical protein
VAHEIGHILGIGSEWSRFDLITTNYLYKGRGGMRGNTVLGMRGRPQIENQGQPGTIKVHWRETTYGNELMTGFLSNTLQPLSALTGNSLLDLGYVVDPTGFDRLVLDSSNKPGNLKNKRKSSKKQLLRGSTNNNNNGNGGDGIPFHGDSTNKQYPPPVRKQSIPKHHHG